MSKLRIGLIVYGLVYLVGAFFVLHGHKINMFIAAYLIVNGSLILFGAVFEHGRYRPEVKDSDQDGWVVTDERFTDDVTGKMMIVRYNPQTGERDYVEDKR